MRSDLDDESAADAATDETAVDAVEKACRAETHPRTREMMEHLLRKATEAQHTQ